MNIYLDIDNTLVTSEGYRTVPAKHLKEFLTNITRKYSVYWLTTHCNGSVKEPLAYLEKSVSPDSFALLRLLKPTTWRLRKVDAIDLNADFLWFDDIILPSEEEVLKKASRSESYVAVDLIRDPDFYTKYLAI